MQTTRARSGAALAALGVILGITVSWWALALWPVGAAVPEWVLRTRDICFGTRPGGLPDAGGWVLLIGEPIGMVGVLLAVWGSALREDGRRLLATRRGQAVAAVVVLGFVYGGTAVARRLRGAERPAEAALFGAGGVAASATGAAPEVNSAAASLSLVDQRGTPFTLAAMRGRPVMVTFAFAHCQTVCPTIVHDLRTARRDARAADPRAADAAIVVVTLDPWRDVPARLPSIAAGWGLDGDDRALSGTVDEVTRVLEAWGVAPARDARTGDIVHAATVVLLDRGGRARYRLAGDWSRAGELLRTL